MNEPPLFERMYGVCSDAVTLATQLSQAPDLPAPEILRQRINATFEGLRQKAQQAGIPSGDAMEAIYALAAFMDEQILRSPWPARQQWMAQPLQLVYFHENTAGEGFYARLAGLEADPNRAHVVQIYYLCLALGFQGRYAVGHPAELAGVLERAGSALARRLPGGDTLSPSAYPERAPLAFTARKFPLLSAALGVLGVSVAVFLVLWVSIRVVAGNKAEKMQSTASAVLSGVKDK